MALERQDILTRFDALMNGPGPVRLDEAALLVAAHERPDEVDMERALDRLDSIAGSIPSPTLDGLTTLLFHDEEFRGNRDDYYNPANSYLDRVLERRLGIPITLAVVMIEVGKRAGVPLFGVGMPGHFLVGDRVDSDVFVDPFKGGARVDRAGAKAVFQEMHGASASFEERFLNETPPTEIVIRLLNNLRMIHSQAERLASLARTMELLVLVPGTPPVERRGLSEVLERIGRVDEAANQLEQLADILEADAEYGAATNEVPELRAKAVRLWAQLN